MLALFIFASLMYFATVVHFSTHNNLVHAQGPWILTVYSDHDSPNPDNGSYNDNDPVTCSVTSPVTEGTPSTVWTCTGWTGTGSVPASGSGSSTGSFNITSDSSITWLWQGTVVQRKLTVVSDHDSPNPSVGDHFYDDSSPVTCSVSSPVTEGNTVWTCTGWTGTGSVPASGSGSSTGSFNITSDSFITWLWQGAPVQWKLTVSSAHDSPNPSVGDHLYNDGDPVTCSATSPVVEGGHSYTCTGWTGSGDVPSSGSGTSVGFTMSENSSITWNWQLTQWILTVNSAHDSPTGSGTYNDGDPATSSVSSPVVESGHSYTCTGWSGTGDFGSGGSGTTAGPFTMTQDSSITWNWKTQYFLTVSSAYDTPGGGGWYDSGSTAYATLTDGTVSGGAGTQYVFTSWGTDASGTNYAQSDAITMNAARTATANWKTQYQVTFGQTGGGSDFLGTVVTVDSVDYGVSSLPVSFWYDTGSSHSFSFASPLAVGSKQYVWSSTSGLSPLQGETITVTASGSVVGNYQVQNQVTFDKVGVSSDFTGTVVIIDSVSYSRAQLPVSFSWSVDSTHSFAFQSPLVVGSTTEQYVWTSTTGLSSAQNGSMKITNYGSIIGHYKTQYYLTVSSPHDSPSPVTGWFDSGSSVTEFVTSPVSGSSSTQYVCTGWTGTGSVPSSGSSSSVTFTMAAASSITWNWQVVQRKLTVSSAHDSPSPTVGNHLYDDGSSVTCSVSSPVNENGTVWTCTGWTGAGSVPSSGGDVSVMFSITQNSSITWNWTVTPSVQWTLTVSSAHGSPDPAVGDHLYNDGSSVVCNVSSPVVDGGVSFTCTGWTGTGSVTSNGSVTFTSFTITENSTITWNWVVTPSVQWTLTVVSAHGTPSPAVGNHLYDSGRSVACSITSPVTEAGQVWTCTGWTGSGSVTSSGSGTSVSFTLTENSSITWDWRVQSTIGSCDGSGVQKNVFKSDETVFVTGRGYGASRTYNVYIVNETTWVDGMTISGRVQGTATSLSSDSSGNINPTAVWSKPLTQGNYDILVDFNGNGKYDAGVDALYSSKIMVAPGYSFIPEYVFGTILGLAGCFAALGAFRMYKRKRQQDT